jgi:hypothetical protein
MYKEYKKDDNKISRRFSGNRSLQKQVCRQDADAGGSVWSINAITIILYFRFCQVFFLHKFSAKKRYLRNVIIPADAA